MDSRCEIGFLKAEHFFNFYTTPNNHHLTIAIANMEKDVVLWFQMMKRNNTFHSWGMFTQALELEFESSPYESSKPCW